MKFFMEDELLAIFVDTNVFVALRNADDTLHERSKKLMRRALKGRVWKNIHFRLCYR